MALNKKLEDFENAIGRLKESYKKAKENESNNEYSFFRDSTIQRFEFTLEISWKSIKEFLLKIEGIECRSPKSCAREFFSIGYLNQDDIALFLEMIDDRNLATHTYHESLAEDIFSKTDSYIILLENIYKTLKENS